MAEGEIVYVAVVPPASLEADLIKGVAGVIGKEVYETRLLLVGSIPRIVARCNGMAEATAIAQGLKELKLLPIVCSDAELLHASHGFAVHKMEFGAGEVTFRDEAGIEKKVKAGEVFLIIRGMVQISEATVTTVTKLKLNVAATALTGGFPIFRKVKKRTGGKAAQSEYFLRLYGRGSSEPVADILQLDLDYSFLGVEAALASLINFTKVVNRLKEIFPQALFDEKLVRTFGTDIPATTAEDDIEINCRLIYLHHLAVSGSKPAA